MVGVVTNVVTWRGMGKRKAANSLRISGLWWCHQESNRGHKDFQSFALPTELWHHLCSFLHCKGREFFRTVQGFDGIFF